MSRVAAFILTIGGTAEARIIPIISATVAFISSFMQHVGAAALFLPVVSRISARSGLPMSRLLMPMAFTAILGGTMTMVGSSPLILLNDLILTSNRALSTDQRMDAWGLFSVTPIGMALVATGIICFVLAGRFVLPSTESRSSTSGSATLEYFHNLYGLKPSLVEVVVSDGSPLIGQLLGRIESDYSIRVIGVKRSGEASRVGPGSLAYDTEIEAGMVLGVIATKIHIETLISKFKLKKRSQLRSFSETLAPNKAGIAEVVIPPGSRLMGDMPTSVIQASVAVLATFFTLVMSNVGATVLLVPLAVNIAIGAGAKPVVYCESN